jgi:hypothetical protein
MARGPFRAAVPGEQSQAEGIEAIGPADVTECRLLFEPELVSLGMTAERKATLNRQHRAIVESFRNRDRAAARSMLREHILFVQSYMFGQESRGRLEPGGKDADGSPGCDVGCPALPS